MAGRGGSAPSLLSGKYLLTFRSVLDPTFFWCNQSTHGRETKFQVSMMTTSVLCVPRVSEPFRGREGGMWHEDSVRGQARPVTLLSPALNKLKTLWLMSWWHGATPQACVRPCWIVPGCHLNYPNVGPLQSLTWGPRGVKLCTKILIFYTGSREALIALCPGKTCK